MATYDSRKDELVNKHLNAVIEQRIDRLVNNPTMLDNETNLHRGYIAALRDFAVFYNGELNKKLNEE